MALKNLSLSDLIDRKDMVIDDAENALLNDFDPIDKAIYNAVRKKILEMNQESGSILFDETNLLVLSQIEAVIIDAIQSSKYPSKVAEYITTFEQIRKYNELIHNKANDITIKEIEKLINPIQKEVVKQTVDGLTGQGITTEFIKPLTEGIYKNIVSGSTISDLQNSLEQVILSDEERMGAFKSYVSRASRDALMQYDGQINSRIATEYELDAYRYVGSIIRDSRPQCIAWVNKGILLKKDLPAMIATAFNSGSGMIPGTTADNFAIYRGGYNCRHSAIPFKLTKSQKSELGLE